MPPGQPEDLFPRRERALKSRDRPHQRHDPRAQFMRDHAEKAIQYSRKVLSELTSEDAEEVSQDVKKDKDKKNKDVKDVKDEEDGISNNAI